MGKKENAASEVVVRVHFHNPEQHGRPDYYFSTLAAIYERFSPEQIGCTLRTLYRSRIVGEHGKETRRCVISKEPLYRAKSRSTASHNEKERQ